MEAPHLRVVKPTPTADEVAAITAAISAVLEGEQKSECSTPLCSSEWVHAARLRARRAGMARGPWRLSGRLMRRTRA